MTDPQGLKPKVDFSLSLLFKKMTPSILDGFYQPLLILNDGLRVLWGNRRYYELFNTLPSETEGTLFSNLWDGEWDISRLTTRLKEIPSSHTEINGLEVARYFNKLGKRTMLLNARQIDSDHADEEGHILLTIEDISARKKEQLELEALSFVDELTKLHNRRGFLALMVDRLKLARRIMADSCFFFADVDGLKNINDAHGHAEGDSALVGIAAILKETFRESDIIARFSGDEFVILMSPAMEGCEGLVAERLKKSLARFNLPTTILYQLSLSMGSFHFSSNDESTIAEMMARADEKLYELKKNRKILFLEEKPYSGDYSKDE